MATLNEASISNRASLHYYRSPSLLSPNGNFAAYSRIQLQVQPEYSQSRITSVLFLENLQARELRAITPTSPLADNPFTGSPTAGIPGSISIVIPIAWSEAGDRILAREFESLFGSDLASDYAVIWDCRSNRASTISPTRIQYTNALLLGWSQQHRDRALFQAGNLGEDWSLWAVDTQGDTLAAAGDQALVFGKVSSSIWAGPQSNQ